MYTLDQIRCFVAIAEELHFGRAAGRLSMTQPPLTRQLQKLEHDVGVRLVDRTNRAVRLTAAGAAFLSEARRLLSVADNATDAARRVARGSVGSIRIGFTAVSAFGLLGQVLSALDDAVPHVEVVLRELVTSAQVRALRRTDIDLALARPAAEVDADPALESMPLACEDLLLALPTGHRFARRHRVRVADLADETLIMYSPVQARYFYDLVVGVLGDVRPQAGQEVTQVHTVVALVAARRGIALVPASARQLGIRGVRFIELEDAAQRPVRLDAVWRREDDDALLARVLDCLRAERFD